MKVVITDYQYENIEQEKQIIGAAGFALYDYQKQAPAELIPLVADADAVITQYSEISAAVIDKMQNCKLIIKYGIGVNNIDVAAASRKGIAVCNVPDYGIEEVSDHAVTMILALAKKLPVITSALREGEWGYSRAIPLQRFRDATVGLVGFGRIPQLVARKLNGFGVNILVHDPYCDERILAQSGVRRATLAELARESDFISLHCPLTAATNQLIDRDFLRAMKKTACLINTSRGPVVDEEALLEALKSGEIAGAGLDVFAAEPPVRDHQLLALEQVIATPHCAWYSEASIRDLQHKVAAEVVNVLQGKPAFNCVNLKELARAAGAS